MPYVADHLARSLDDHVVGELVRAESVVEQRVEALGITSKLVLRRVVRVAQDLDDDGCLGKPEVDAHQSPRRLREHCLRFRTGKFGRSDETQKLAFEPTVPTAGRLRAFDHPDQGRDSVSTRSAQRDDSAVQGGFAELAVAET